MTIPVVSTVEKVGGQPATRDSGCAVFDALDPGKPREISSTHSPQRAALVHRLKNVIRESKSLDKLEVLTTL